MQRLVVNTLFQGKKVHHNQEDGSEGSTNIGPVLEVTTSCLHGKHGVEIRIWSLNGDNTHSWVLISHGSNKFVMDSNNDTEVPQDQFQEQASHLNAEEFVSQPKVKTKPQRREPVDYSPSIIPMNERKWIDIEPGKHSLSEYEVSKKVIHLLRHSQQVHREEDGAVHFWRRKENLQNQFPQSIHWSDDRWKVCLAAGGGAKKKISVLYWWFRNNHLFPSSSKTFRTQSYWSFIAGQCCDSERILPIPYWMWIQFAFYHQFWINTWRSQFEQETDGVLLACWS